jgi:hypothetical protein
MMSEVDKKFRRDDKFWRSSLAEFGQAKNGGAAPTLVPRALIAIDSHQCSNQNVLSMTLFSINKAKRMVETTVE